MYLKWFGVFANRACALSWNHICSAGFDYKSTHLEVLIRMMFIRSVDCFYCLIFLFEKKNEKGNTLNWIRSIGSVINRNVCRLILHLYSLSSDVFCVCVCLFHFQLIGSVYFEFYSFSFVIFFYRDLFRWFDMHFYLLAWHHIFQQTIILYHLLKDDAYAILFIMSSFFHCPIFVSLLFLKNLLLFLMPFWTFLILYKMLAFYAFRMNSLCSEFCLDWMWFVFDEQLSIQYYTHLY